MRLSREGEGRELAVVLLADTSLLQLPLEALGFLQGDSVHALARDFSVQMLHHRLAKLSGGGETGSRKEKKNGPVRESNPGPLAPEARIMPLDQLATSDVYRNFAIDIPCHTCRARDHF